MKKFLRLNDAVRQPRLVHGNLSSGGRDHISGSSFIRTAGDDIELPGGFHTDQDFIAHARQDIPVLTAEIRCLKVIVG